MFLRAVFLFILLAGVGLLVQLGHEQPGQVTIVWLGYEIQTSALLLAFLVGAITVMAFNLGSFWVWLNTIPKNFANWRQEKIDHVAIKALIESHEALAAGDFNAVKRLSKQTKSLLPGPGFSDLLEASAHMGQHDFKEAAKNFQRLRNNPKTKFLGIQGLLNAAYMSKKWDECLLLAREAYQLKPHSPWVLQKLYESFLKTGRYDASYRLLMNEFKGKKVFDDATQAIHECALTLQLTADETAGQGAKHTFALLEKAWKRHPNNLPLGKVYAEKLVQQGQFKKAEKLLAQLWKQWPRGDLVTAWLMLMGNMPDDKLLQKAKKVFKAEDASFSGNLAMAALYLQLKRYTEAQKELNGIPGDHRFRNVYELLAKIDLRSGGKSSQEYLQKALKVAPMVDPGADQFTDLHHWQQEYLPKLAALPKPKA